MMPGGVNLTKFKLRMETMVRTAVVQSRAERCGQSGSDFASAAQKCLAYGEQWEYPMILLLPDESVHRLSWDQIQK
jgi:hypothetical protein